MEFLRRLLCFGIGFVFAVSIVVLDDRMSLNYGYVRTVEERPSLEVFATHKM